MNHGARTGGSRTVVWDVQVVEPRAERARPRRHSLPSDVVMLRPVVAVDVDVRTGVDGVDDGVGALSRRGGVHPHGLAAVVLLHRAVAVGIIPVERHISVVAEGAQAVPGVPQQLALRDFRGGAAITTFSCHGLVCQVAVGVVRVMVCAAKIVL